MSAALTHAELVAALDAMQLGVDASDMHGSLAGYLCAGGRAGPGQVLEALQLESDDAAVRDRAHALLDRLYGEALAQLDDPQLGFGPLLPDDEYPLDQRAEALVEWCRGFLGGFGLAGDSPSRKLSDDGKEILHDFGAIAGSHLSSRGDEEDERALAEVLEFVRVGAMLLFAEVAAMAGPGPASTTLH